MPRWSRALYSKTGLVHHNQPDRAHLLQIQHNLGNLRRTKGQTKTHQNMATKLKLLKEKYSLNGRRVTCTAHYSIAEYCDGETHWINKVFVDEAVCHPDDTFDQATGEHIASSRARIGAIAWARQFNKNALEFYRRMAYECGCGIDKYSEALGWERDHLKQLKEL